MSYTVLLVEDEQLVREELAQTTPWESLGLELIATSADGIDGEAKIRLLSPDIVITDIRLPGQDGLQMLSKVPVSHAVIISGYTDFSYTRTAIQLGVFDYLQKPVDSDQLEAVLKSLVGKIREEDISLASLRNQTNSNEGELIMLPKSVFNHVINNAISFIAANYSRPVGLQEAAVYLDLSESHLSRLFKDETGLNFLQYLNAWRVNKAAILMLDSRKSISEVAVACGFPSPGYFAKIFKRFSGYTPSQYRDIESKKLGERKNTGK